MSDNNRQAPATDRTAQGGQPIPLENVMQRITRGIRYAFTGNVDWFGPGKPNEPSAPIEVEGRQFQLPINVNPLIQTKTEGITFDRLRTFSYAADIVRILIENRKDTICGMEWTIQKRDPNDTGLVAAKKAKNDRTADMLEDFFKSPDTDHDWADWSRLLLEDLLAIDAPALYFQKTKGGELHALRPIAGDTIKRIIDGHGWTPAPPDPAYQQILQGQTALSYTTEELIYKPRNIVTNRLYAIGRVEQIVVTIQTWLARQASNLEYYDKGSTPDGFLSASAGWGPKEIGLYQVLFDEQLSGQLGERRKIKITPADSKYTATKEPALKGDYDEWLARIACFCFGTSPQAFIKQMNRATAETAKESSSEEGVQSDMMWLKRLHDHIIQRRMGFTEYEFVWQDREAQDPLERAQVDQIYLDRGVLTPNEVRTDLGKDPLPEPEEDEPHIQTTEAPVGSEVQASGGNGQGNQTVKKPPGPDGGSAPGPKAEGAVAAAPPKKRSPNEGSKTPNDATWKLADGTVFRLGKVAPRRFKGEANTQHKRLIKLMKTTLGHVRDAVVKEFRDKWPQAYLKMAKDDRDISAEPAAFAAAVSMDAWSVAWDDYNDVLEITAADGTVTAIAKVSVEDMDGEVDDITNLANDDAIAWAGERAAAMIGKAADGSGALPEATRAMIQRTIAQGMAEGKTTEEIAALLMGDYAFSEARAELIAETEVGNASAHGQLIGYQDAGLKTKTWVLSDDEGVCPICEGNADQGAIPIDQAFDSGDDAPLAHPNCRCDIIAGTSAED